MPVSSAIVVGGGICGLATAIGLRSLGVDARVYETGSELREVGAGLTLWANGVYALTRLGFTVEEIEEAGQAVSDFRCLTSSGNVLGLIDVKSFDSKMGLHCVSIHRRRLMELLEAHVPAEIVHLNKRLVSHEDTGDRVIAKFADGTAADADILLGCDGFHSRAREQLLGADEPRYAGYTCWRGVANVGEGVLPNGAIWHTFGPGAAVGLLAVGNGSVAWYATANVPAGEKQTQEERKRTVLSRLGNWHKPIPVVLEATAATELLKNDIYDRRPVSNWAKGRVLLMGDAAHPTTPNLGQGACQALEDAATLTACFAGGANHERAFAEFLKKRVERCAFIVNSSRRAGEVGQVENPVLCFLRDFIAMLTLKSGSIPEFARSICYKC